MMSRSLGHREIVSVARQPGAAFVVAVSHGKGTAHQLPNRKGAAVRERGPPAST